MTHLGDMPPGDAHDGLRVETTFRCDGTPCTDEVATHLMRTWRDVHGRAVIRECIVLSPMRAPGPGDLRGGQPEPADLRMLDRLLDELDVAARAHTAHRGAACGLVRAIRGAMTRLCGTAAVGAERRARLRRMEHRLGLIAMP